MSDNLNTARQWAAQAWCQPTTSHKVMDAGLAEAFARILCRFAEAKANADAKGMVALGLPQNPDAVWTIYAGAVQDWFVEHRADVPPPPEEQP